MINLWSFYVCDNLLFIDHHCLTNYLHHPFSHPQVSLSLLLLSFSHLQNHCCHSHFSKIFIMPFPWGWGRNRLVQNEVRFLCHQNMFLISIHIFLLFSTCTLAKQITCYFWSILHSYYSLYPKWLSQCLCLGNSSKAQGSLNIYNLSHSTSWGQKSSTSTLSSHSTFYMFLITCHILS